ncbi:hypothetical protein NECAME_08995 [Necator americanus]|uniref:Ammonium transporter AmtB-like domain-containing protein n=1 Tax=Necator americanus TaxID=51031 RepID=W2TFV2_NECAM|nr:hypothetical protein NECAME_08995 [Necator americanus]ETN80713.1 hypothetical protein NECAME_08995 [Necator americanus]
MFGYGFTFGESNTNPFIGVGDYFFDPEREDMSASDKPGTSYALFLFQMSFATTTSTIVSAGMAERIHLQSHCFVSFFITLVHSVAGHWVWHRSGVFRAMGVVDSAGCSAYGMLRLDSKQNLNVRPLTGSKAKSACSHPYKHFADDV